MKYLEEIADTLGFDLQIADGGLIHGHSKRPVRLTEGLEVPVKLKIVSSYHDPAGDIAILIGELVGNLGFMIYNSNTVYSSDENGIALECTELAFFDRSKLNFHIDNVFEINPNLPPDTIALWFDKALVCQVRRVAGEKTFTLIDDRRNHVDISTTEKPDALQLKDRGVDPVAENEQHATGFESRG